MGEEEEYRRSSLPDPLPTLEYSPLCMRRTKTHEGSMKIVPVKPIPLIKVVVGPLTSKAWHRAVNYVMTETRVR